ncbi:hypothetical protein ACT6NV_06380 [Robiginitalea sp. IMCC44478]|uniref:hypothetical protein n=1 Tax=Robiginitalea sp. IMCC44478 TaxID=3459122 RepID=UPI0040414F9C
MFGDLVLDGDSSTTMFKEEKPKLRTHHWELNTPVYADFLSSVFTSIFEDRQRPLDLLDDENHLTDDYDIISKFTFKNSRKIKARIHKSGFNPTIVID